MKKHFTLFLVLVLLMAAFGAVSALAEEENGNPPPLPPHIKDGVSVVAIFAGDDKQPFALENHPDEDRKIDTVWIYFSDNTFDQYAELRHEYELFSTGTYAFTNGGSFGADGQNGSIVIERNQKYSEKEKRLVEYASSHEYVLGTLGFTQIFGPEDGKEIEAITGDNKYIDYVDEEGVWTKLDSVWLYYTDGTFVDYVFLNGEIVQNGAGTYAFDETGDFHLVPTDKDHGKIIITWEKSLTGLAGEKRTYDLSTWSEFFFEKHDASLLPPEGTPPAEVPAETPQPEETPSEEAPAKQE